MDLSAEIFCLGNELLIGRTVNKNATEIALELTKLGIKVNRIMTVRDDLKAATHGLQEILERQPQIICITGGLGPTHDDIQLDIIAAALNRSIQLNHQALEMISSKYKEINEARRKMAMLPSGSSPLTNSQGSAPGVLTIEKDIHIFSLPGVPREMKAILHEEIVPYLQKKFDLTTPLIEYGIDIRGARESDIAKIIDQVRNKYPDVNFKSHPRFDGEKYWLSLHTYANIEDKERVRNALEHWVSKIEDEYSVTKSSMEPIFTQDFEPE